MQHYDDYYEHPMSKRDEDEEYIMLEEVMRKVINWTYNELYGDEEEDEDDEEDSDVDG